MDKVTGRVPGASALRVQPDGSSRPDSSWGLLFRAGGWSAVVFVVLVLVPVVLVFVAPVPPTRGAGLLEYIAVYKAVYLTELVCFVGLAVPALMVFSAAALALKDVNKNVAAIGGLFGLASEVIALALGSSPQSLHGGLVVLSNAYQTAGEADRTGLVSAAEALIASTNAVSWAGILTAAAILLLSALMRRTSFFGPVLGTIGLVAGAAGIVSEALRPIIGPAYMIYGLLLPTWFALVGWKLLHLDKETSS